jgi:hypothetical protein
MFKALMFFIIMALLIVVIISIFKMMTPSSVEKKRDGSDFSLEFEIISLKAKIKNYEERAKYGMDNAEAKLLELKEELKKAEEFKLKHNL